MAQVQRLHSESLGSSLSAVTFDFLVKDVSELTLSGVLLTFSLF